MTREELWKQIALEAELRGFTLDQVIRAAYNKALDDAVEAVKLEKASNYGRYSEDPKPNFKPVELDVVDHTFYGHGDCGYEAVRVDKTSILKLKVG